MLFPLLYLLSTVNFWSELWLGHWPENLHRIPACSLPMWVWASSQHGGCALEPWHFYDLLSEWRGVAPPGHKSLPGKEGTQTSWLSGRHIKILRSARNVIWLFLDFEEIHHKENVWVIFGKYHVLQPWLLRFTSPCPSHMHGGHILFPRDPESPPTKASAQSSVFLHLNMLRYSQGS